jgi:hypothetical protein
MLVVYECDLAFVGEAEFDVVGEAVREQTTGLACCIWETGDPCTIRLGRPGVAKEREGIAHSRGGAGRN